MGVGGVKVEMQLLRVVRTALQVTTGAEIRRGLGTGLTRLTLEERTKPALPTT
jgi:hypothetical protein